MREGPWLLVVRLSAVLALAVSSALLMDYTNPVQTFCGVGSGCAAVRGSGYGYYLVGDLPVPVPVFGLIGFGALFGASFVPERLRPALLTGCAGIGGLISLALIWLQAAKVGQFCALCVIVDVLALIAAAAAVVYLRASRGASQPAGNAFDLRSWAWVALAFTVTMAPPLWSAVRPAPPVPARVLELYKPGKINVVEFADFQCPFCRLLHERLKPMIASYGGRVHFIRLNMPLNGHQYARGAAYAAICAEEQGHGEPMADRLFAAEDLTPAANRRAAKDLGLDLRAFDRCVESAATEARVARESKILMDAGLKGLPTTYVGAEEIVGAQPDEKFRDAFDRAEQGSGNKGVPGPLFLAFFGLSLAALVRFGRASYNSTWDPAQTKKPEQAKSPST